MTSYQVDPALEYRTFAHVSSQPISIIDDRAIRRRRPGAGRGHDRGVALWDLARGAELAFLPIGNAGQVIFEALRRPAYERVDRRAAVADSARPRPGRIPHRPATPAPAAGRTTADRRGPDRAGSWPWPTMTLPSSRPPSGPSMWAPWTTAATLPSARTANGWPPAVMADEGRQVWQVRDATQVARAADRLRSSGRVQPRWEMADDDHPPCRLWAVGTWREARQIGGEGRCFSPDGRLVVVVRMRRRVIRLVETETGRTVARLESPDLCDVWAASFQPRRLAPGGHHQ